MGKVKSKIKHVTAKAALAARGQVLANPRLKNYAKKAAHLLMPAKLPMLTYASWVTKNFLDPIEVVRQKQAIEGFDYRPLISILIPTYNTDPQFLKDCLDSVLSQSYGNWEVCIVDDASPGKLVRTIIKEYADRDDRFKYKFLKLNKHISGATNVAATMASGEFISLFDHDDMLWPNALFEVVKALNDDSKLDVLYTDEDKITEDRHEHLGYFFKPDWNPDFLHSVNYITHFTTIRRTLFESLGGLNATYNGAQDWDLLLRAASATQHIYHIPKVVYSWRIHKQSTAMSTDSKPYVVAAQQQALHDDLTRQGYPEATVKVDPVHSGYWQVTYPVKDNPLISVVIPSKNQYKIVKRCIDSIYALTTYKNFEIVLVDTGSTDKKVLDWYKMLTRKHDNFKLVMWPEQPFSYSRSCNQGAKVAQGELLVMLNNDTEIITANWLELLAGDAQRSDVGAVGCLLFFPDGRHIQHAGIGIGLGGIAANSFSRMTLDQAMSQTQHLMINTKHNMTAVTAACLMLRKSVFEQIGGFDEAFRVTYNDVDLCLKLHANGYQNVYTPYVRLLHHESISVGLPNETKKRDNIEFKQAERLFKTRWKRYIAHDPNLNPNLNKTNAFYDI